MKKEKIMPIVTIVLAVLCVAGFVTYSISRSMLLDTKEKVNNLKLNVKVTQATNDEIEPTVVVETVNPKNNLENKLTELNSEIQSYTKHKSDMIEIAESLLRQDIPMKANSMKKLITFLMLYPLMCVRIITNDLNLYSK